MDRTLARGAVFAAVAMSLFIATASSRASDDTATLKDRLHTAARQSTLSGGALQPYHLKMSVQLFDNKGKPSEQGTVDVYWAGAGKEKHVYAFPSCSATEVRTDGKLFRTPNANSPPAMVDLLVNQLLDPMPPDSIIDGSQPEMQKINFGKVPLECIMLAKPIEGLAKAPMGLFPTYCFNPGNNILRARFNYGTQLVLRNSVIVFQQKRYLAQDITVRLSGVDTAKGQVLTSENVSVADADLATEGMQEIGYDAPVKIASGITQGLAVSQVQPVYPERAKENHAQGKVVMHAIIGKDGHIRDLDVVSSPDPDLAVAAVAAVRQWTYRPYLLNGVPVEVETTINVNFTFGPG